MIIVSSLDANSILSRKLTLHVIFNSIHRIVLAVLEMIVRATSQANRMIVLQSYKKLMLKAMYNSHQHLHLIKESKMSYSLTTTKQQKKKI